MTYRAKVWINTDPHVSTALQVEWKDGDHEGVQAWLRRMLDLGLSVRANFHQVEEPKTDHRVLSSTGAASFLGTSTARLAIWRRDGTGPRWEGLKAKPSYRVDDLTHWAETGTR